MKIKKLAIALLLLPLVGCKNNNHPSRQEEDDPPYVEETYTIRFYSDDELIKQVDDAKYGEYIDIPEITSSVSGRELIGWSDISKKEFQAGKVKVYETDADYYAIWTEVLDPARKLFSAVKTSDEITIDGNKDEKYNAAPIVDINVKTLVESGDPAAIGKASVLWDDSYLYVYVDVTDGDVNLSTSSHPEQNDSVELWISTCQSSPTSETTWGESNRPYSAYCGEGLFRMGAGAIEPTGFHWMFDNKSLVGREIVSKLKEHGYTVEYKIGWGTFGQREDKENQIIDFNININDRGTSGRKGMVSTNEYGHLGYQKPYYLDHLILLGETL